MTAVEDVAERYWHDTFAEPGALWARGLGEEGSPDEPPKFKHYPGAPRRALPQQLPAGIGPLSSAFTGGTARPLDLGSLLWHGYGFSRVDVGPVRGWPYHRTVPSARCFYPTELYVCLPGEGVFHYDQLHHGLVRLRDGDHLATVAAATGADLSGASAVVLLTSHFWKTAFRYRHYAYRLCTQEAGMVAGNVLMVAAALGHPAHLHLQFLDPVLDRLLGLVPGEERTMAVLPLYPGRRELRRSGGPARDAADLLARLPAIDVPFRDVAKDLELAGDVYRVDAASVLEHTDRFAEPRVAPAAAAPAGLAVPVRDRLPDLADALRQRHSGGTLFRPVPQPLAAQDFGPVVRHVAEPYPSDLGDAPLGTPYYLVQDVTGVPPGVYRGEAGALHRVADLPAGRLDSAIMVGVPVFDSTTVNVLCYLVTDREEVTRRWGARGYRIAAVDSGVTAQRTAVLAAASGVAARPVNGYGLAAVQRLLALPRPGLTPIFQIGLGHRAVGPQYELPIVF